LFRRLYSFKTSKGFSLPEILVVVAILGVLAAIAIPVSMSQQSRASDASIRSDLTNVAAVVEGQLLAWRGAPRDGALNICNSTSGEYPPVNDPTNTCEEGQWRVTRTSNNQFLSPPMEGKLSPGIFVQGRIASDGSYCLDGSSSRSGAKNFYFDSQSSQVQEGTCRSISWAPRGSLVGSTGATTTPGDLPPPPSGVAVEVAEGGSTATVKWNAQAGVTYIVKISNEPAKTLTASTTGVVRCVFPAESCEGPETGNLMVGTYTAIVRAGNSEGWGAGATQDFKIENTAGGSSSLNRIPPPSQPTVSQSGADINVSWSEPTESLPDGEEIIKYRISWSENGSRWVGEVETGSSDTEFKLLGSSFVSGKTYFFRIQAISDSGILGRPSQTSTVLNYVVTKPAPPGLLYSVGSFNKVDLFWTGSSANTYVIERLPLAGIVGNPICTNETTSNCRATITSLTNGTVYVFNVRTKDPQGVLSDPSTTTATPSASLPPTSPLSPSVAGSPSTDGRTLRVSWKAPFSDGGRPIVQYQIQWSFTGIDNSWSDLNAVLLEERNIPFNAGDSIYTYTFNGNLISGTRYYFRIRAVNAEGFGDPSLTVDGTPLYLNPVWVTASSSLGTAVNTRSFSTSVNASNASRYLIVSGSLPPGLSLNQNNGVISGASTSQADYTSTVFNFTIAAENPNGVRVNRAFAITNRSLFLGRTCATAGEGGVAAASTPGGTVIGRIDFVSYGTPNGSCGSYSVGWCHAGLNLSGRIGTNSFSVGSNNSVFGDPCGGTVKRLYIQVSYRD
jgi:prepilin-type N-terminal cleavage/methylation domain-containing protein